MKDGYPQAALAPSSIAVAGASGIPGTLGDKVWRSLKASAYAHVLHAVNFNFGELTGAVVFGRVRDLPVVPALAIICSPPAKVAALVDDFGQLGTHDVMVLTEGLDAAQQQALRAAAAQHGIRVLEPAGLEPLLASQPPAPDAAAAPAQAQAETADTV